MSFIKHFYFKLFLGTFVDSNYSKQYEVCSIEIHFWYTKNLFIVDADWTTLSQRFSTSASDPKPFKAFFGGPKIWRSQSDRSGRRVDVLISSIPFVECFFFREAEWYHVKTFMIFCWFALTFTIGCLNSISKVLHDRKKNVNITLPENYCISLVVTNLNVFVAGWFKIMTPGFIKTKESQGVAKTNPFTSNLGLQTKDGKSIANNLYCNPICVLTPTFSKIALIQSFQPIDFCWYSRHCIWSRPMFSSFFYS